MQEEVEAEETAEEKPKAKKNNAITASEGGEVANGIAVEQSNKKAKKNGAAQAQEEKRKSGTPFSRVDQEKWRKAVSDGRFLDNTHEAKKRFGMAAGGDSWGDKAAEDLGKVKGKGFRKEMAKKKRSSWKGGGQLDQGVNSIMFPDSDDDE